MSRFHVRQRVVCVNSQHWIGPGPARNEVVTIANTRIDATGDFGLMFHEYPSTSNPWYTAQYFRPLDPLEQQLERIEEECVELESEYA